MIKEQKSETPYHKGDTKMDYNKLALEMHEQNKGKIAVRSKVTVKTRDDLSTAYTPGVAEPCRKIRDNKEEVYRYTAKGNLVAVVSDGTAVLGLGDIGPEAAMPVMEGKALYLKNLQISMHFQSVLIQKIQKRSSKQSRISHHVSVVSI